MPTVEMWFDPTCPYAWLTSRWLVEVEQVRDVRMCLHIMSLSVLNEDRDDLTDADRRTIVESWGPVRVAMATLLSLGDEGVRDFYTAIGPMIHRERRRPGRDLYALALDAAGLPHSLANAAKTTYYDDAIRVSHHAGLDPLGPSAACPVIHVPNGAGTPVAFMGPLVIPVPRGEGAGRLWDAVATAADTDEFFQIRRHLDRPAIVE